MTPKAHVWHPITDLPDNPKSLTDGELEPLGKVWKKLKKELTDRRALDEFQKRLWREWSIETGVIENVFTLDRGVTRTLIAQGINSALIPHGASNRDGVAVARIIQDHYEALEGMFDFVSGQRALTTGYIKELHAALLRNQNTHEVVDQFGRLFLAPLERGAYKTLPNNPTRDDGSVHEYCPPEHVASEMDELVRMHAEHQSRSIPAEVKAAWLHHRFTQIHPFADGNGRVARAIASLVFIKAEWFPLIVKGDDPSRSRYVGALEKADGGDLRLLIAMFVESQREALIQANEVAYDGRPVESEEEAVAAVRDRLVQRGQLEPEEWLAPKQAAKKLMDLAENRLAKLEGNLAKQVRAKGFSFGHSTRNGINSLETELLKKIGHVADPLEYFWAVQLSMNTVRPDTLAIAGYALGPRYRGVIGIVAYLVRQGESEAALIEGGTFQTNYEEDFEGAKARFSPWLERIIVKGLDQWRRIL